MARNFSSPIHDEGNICSSTRDTVGSFESLDEKAAVAFIQPLNRYPESVMEGDNTALDVC
jgi:hypothetical protein